MKADIKRRWVEALRSGEYEQCFGHLRKRTEDGARFCAMGVLVDLAVQDGMTTWVDVRNAHQILTLRLRDWCGLDNAPEILDTGCPCCNNVICANDTYRMTFTEIADRIEARVPGEDDEPPVEEPPIPDEQEDEPAEVALAVPVFLDLFAKDVVPDRVPELV